MAVVNSLCSATPLPPLMAPHWDVAFRGAGGIGDSLGLSNGSNPSPRGARNLAWWIFTLPYSPLQSSQWGLQMAGTSGRRRLLDSFEAAFPRVRDPDVLLPRPASSVCGGGRGATVLTPFPCVARTGRGNSFLLWSSPL